MDIGEKIQKIRKQKNITQSQLSELIYRTKRTVQKYEYNEIDISLGALEDISKALDVSIISLITEDDDILNIIKDYYNLEDKNNYNIEKDFKMIMEGFINRYKK